MELRTFDIILKDIVNEASWIGEYEPIQTKNFKKEVDVLSKHASSAIRKRFYFKNGNRKLCKNNYFLWLIFGSFTESVFLLIPSRMKRSFETKNIFKNRGKFSSKV